MEDPNNNDYYEEENNKGPHLPISQESGLNFQSLLKLNQAYAKQLLNMDEITAKILLETYTYLLPKLGNNN